jgi:hypothetical protein
MDKLSALITLATFIAFGWFLYDQNSPTNVATRAKREVQRCVPVKLSEIDGVALYRVGSDCHGNERPIFFSAGGTSTEFTRIEAGGRE